MQTFFKEFVILINILYWLPMFISIVVAVAVVWILGKRFKVKRIYRIIVSVLLAYLVSLYWYIPVKKAEEEKIAKYNERKAKYEVAKAVFDEQCKKAGEKIYRTVDNVDGVMLLKIRKENKENRSVFELWSDPMWEDAAIAGIESSKGTYIGSFLHNRAISKGRRGYLFVDVLKEDGSISRYLDYKGHDDIDEERDGVIKNPSDLARYAVTYENNVDPELRKYWVAGITIKIIDRQTDELLAEKTIFSFEPGLGSKAIGRMPWTDWRVEHCPELMRRDVDHNPTQLFAIQVLKPTRFFNSSFNGDQK